MTVEPQIPLIEFLKQDLGISHDSIKVALNSCDYNPGPLPLILWQYGLISLEQLNDIFDWIETSSILTP
ncbi:MAG: DUF2949 domain-containing protein [Acaryochloridaceae cyanobacterium SU_2_1]|nr:DUF2949 domain-containing protein [Acaryochloridaceae cyanobacterium SU_2_1]